MEFEFDDYTCIEFTFKKGDTSKLLFFTATEIIEYDYLCNDVLKQETTIYQIDNFFMDPPTFGIWSPD
jgi:hypothetical protein